ncbi:EamA family transporter [Salinicoccus hispanicus]|uniref:EamA family transporter n=1 Tax=Salinicoccus hispanicus TaxID=157225 RepID=A0A6N8TZH2_9STAP|nr:EamA family transporter [Salinicoccus hispanicus]MXQ51408.1 EamA family transporter [Salinicoccus hispanicus]
MKSSLAPIMILVAAILWGTAGTAKTYLPENVDSLSIGAMRLIIGSLILIIIALFMRQFRIKGWPWRMVLAAGIAMALFQPFFFNAVTLTGVAVGTVASIGSAPVFSGLIEWLFFKIRPDRVWWVSTTLAILGCALLMFNTGSITVDPLGILSGLGAGVTFASYTIMNSRMVRNHPPIAITAIVFTISALLLTPFLLLNDPSWLATTGGISVSLYIGLFATGLAYFLFASGLKHVKSSSAVTLSLAEPLTASLLGVLFVGEVLALWSWAGLIMLLAGLVLLALQSRGRSRKIPTQT